MRVAQTSPLRALLKWVAPIAAFLVYGGWSFWINRSNANGAAIAGILQGSYAVLSTVALRLGVEALDRQLAQRQFGKSATWGISVVVLMLLPASLHWIAGTVEILLSILPGLVVGSGYVALILLSLRSQPAVG